MTRRLPLLLFFIAAFVAGTLLLGGCAPPPVAPRAPSRVSITWSR